MLHQLPTEQLGPHADAMAKAVQACVHCGFCLPVCPTYQELGQEMDSPRGRIILMKEALESGIPEEEALPHVDRCLGCLACEPACPSGVPYRDLLSPFRARAEKNRERGLIDRLLRWSVSATLPYPARFALAARMARLGKPIQKFLPRRMAAMLDLLPDQLPKSATLQSHYEPIGQRRGRVALLTGCAQSVLEPDINLSTIEVLRRNGVEVLIPPNQTCCGSLAWHVGDLPAAQHFARNNLDAFPADVDAIITNAAGCGSGMQEYGHILAGTAQERTAHEFSERVVDVTVYLDQLGLVEPPTLNGPLKVAYQDACHLRNAQGVIDPPRFMLSKVGNLQLVEIPDGALCCGSAGTYNIDQPDIAASLGKRKIEAIQSSGAEHVVSGNIGCITQMKFHAREANFPLTVQHTMQLLAQAYSNSESPS